jgi:hypothetical protein
VSATLLAGCGGGSESEGTTTTTADAAPKPARALDALVQAAHDGDEAAMRRVLTADTLLEPTALSEGLGTFSAHRARPLYVGDDWAVATISGLRTVEGMRERSAYAAAVRLVNGRWRVDLSLRVRIRILGPDPGSTTGPMPQVAAEITAPDPLAESGLWVDGAALEVKGGGTPKRGTIYGAPATDLRSGTHTAVAYARTARNGTAVAWRFNVR